MNKLFYGAGSVLALATLVWAGAVHGQSGENEGASQGDVIDVIVVTATKRAENLEDVPMSINAFSGEALVDRGINSVQDLVKVTPGLSFVDGGLGVPVYSLRGVGFFETSIGARPTVATYLDEAPLPFSIMAEGAMFDLERVEVLKGPQGTLFGQNSTGGAINFIAAKPRETWGSGGTVSFSRFSTSDIRGYVTGPITDNMNFRTAVRSVQGSGWQESASRDDEHGSKDFVQGRALLDWQATDLLKISLNLNGFIDRSETQASQLIGRLFIVPSAIPRVQALADYPLTEENIRAADWDEGTDYRKDTKFYQATVRGDYDLSDEITLTSLTSWSKITVDQNNDVDGTALPHSDIAIVGEITAFSQELRAIGDSGPFSWIVGGNYSNEDTVENDFLNFPFASANFAFNPNFSYDATNPFTAQDFETFAVFANVDYDIGRFTLHGGARFTQANLDYAGCTKVNNDSSGAAITTLFNTICGALGLNAIDTLRAGDCQSIDATFTPGLREESFDQNNVGFRAGVKFSANDDVLLYANVSRGFKAGSVPAVGAINLEEFDPVNQEELLAYEAGFKASLPSGLANMTAAGFYYDYTDKQLLARKITTPDIFGALPALVNVPESRILGAEAQVNLFPIEGLRFTVAGTYLDSKVEGDFENFTILATQENFKGNAFPYTPEWQVVADGEYRFPINQGVVGLIGGIVNYRSETTAGFGTNDFLDIDSYTTIDIRLGLEAPDGKWSVQAFGRNITDEYYWTNIGKFNDVVRRIAGDPETYGVQVGFNF